MAQMNWEKEYIEDEIEMELNSDSDVWSCYWFNILFSCTQTNATKVKQSNGKWNRINCQVFQPYIEIVDIDESL